MLAKSEDTGLIYAATRDGYELPVIDVTHPRFHVADDADAQRKLKDALLKSERQRRLFPKFLMRWMLKSASKKSRLINALFGTDATFLDGITTYVMKLGADNLVPPYDSPVDKKFAAAPYVTYLRLRAQQMAKLMAEGLVPHLVANDKPLAIINIAGGPAVDTINAMILLAKRTPALPKRKIAIHVLDQDDAGPFFGRNALAAMQAEGGPLADHDITFDHRTYDWNDTTMLSSLVAELANDGAIIAASSEGGLFEYGSDHAIVENLKALNAKRHGVRLVVGSVTRDDELRRRMMEQSRIQLVPRGIKGFRPLAAQAGFSIIEIRPTIWSDQVLMVP